MRTIVVLVWLCVAVVAAAGIVALIEADDYCDEGDDLVLVKGMPYCL